MKGAGSRDERMVEAVRSALEPYQWRRFRPELLARSLLAARDRQLVLGLLRSVPGAAAGAWAALEPADRNDPRVTPLVGFLASHRWTELSLDAVCRELLARLDDGS